MPIKLKLKRYFTRKYLERSGVECMGELPLINFRCPPKFVVYGKLVLGSGVKFITTVGGRATLHVDREAILTVGAGCVINGGVWIRSTKEISIGENTLIGPYVEFFDRNLHPLFPGDPDEPEPVIIGKGVWVGVGSKIRKGVLVGDYSTIAMGAVVTKDVPPKMVVGGNPAKVIKDLVGHDFTNWSRELNKYV